MLAVLGSDHPSQTKEGTEANNGISHEGKLCGKVTVREKGDILQLFAGQRAREMAGSPSFKNRLDKALSNLV